MKLCCLRPDATNVSLIKHVGLTPFYLKKTCNYKSKITTFYNEEYSYADNELKGLEIDIIEEKYPFNILNIISYLKNNSKDIDVLRCFHYSLPTFFYFLIYKLFNRNGIVFFAIDTDYPTALRLNGYKKGIRFKFETLMSIFLFKHLIDLATIETKKAYNVFVQSHEIYKEKLLYVPLFINPDKNIEKNKKNQVISVGRIGSHQKASEIVLESYKCAVEKLKTNDWILKMVGPVSNDFQEYIELFFNENPHLKDQIIFTGNIESRKELYEIYAESKIFCLPSRYGSFEIVFAEALFYDNYLIISEVGVGDYLISISEFGNLVEIDNVKNISNNLINAMENYDEYLDNNKIDFKKLIKKEFHYDKYIKLIANKIEDIHINKIKSK